MRHSEDHSQKINVSSFFFVDVTLHMQQQNTFNCFFIYLCDTIHTISWRIFFSISFRFKSIVVCFLLFFSSLNWDQISHSFALWTKQLKTTNEKMFSSSFFRYNFLFCGEKNEKKSMKFHCRKFFKLLLQLETTKMVFTIEMK